MKVPEPLRYIFNRFPLKTFPAIEDNTHHQENEFYFGLNEASSCNEQDQNFCLGVHNIQPVCIKGEKKYIPTDPVSLGNCLILCFRNNLFLPSKGKQPLSRNSMRLMSYLVSDSKELPVLIETNGSRTESITDSKSFAQSVSLKYFSKDLQGFLINHLLDNLNDLWILILLVDVHESGSFDYSKLFYQDPEIASNKIANSLTTMKLVADIPYWTSFKIRYPHLFHSHLSTNLSGESLRDLINSFNSKAIEKTCIEKLQDFERTIPLVNKYLDSIEESDSRSIIELKFASFVFVTSTFVSKSSHIGRLLEFKFKDVISFSKEVISRY